MELHPFLEPYTRPNPGWWYVMSAAGECPSMRVGHSCIFLRGQDEADAGKLYIIGGANPSGPFSDTFVLDLNTRRWDTVDSAGLRPRYEHAAFVPTSYPQRIYVFGGANQAGNMNDVQYLDTVTSSWTTVLASGTAPAARTHHTMAAVGDKLIVYSGGHTGADPVGDRQVHIFDASNEAWSVPTLRGDSPKPRHGHAMAAVGKKVFVHGGMAGSTFYDDLHVLDLDKSAWVSVKKKRNFPTARAAHGAVARGSDVFIFGGMNKDGALDDLHKLDTVTLTWTHIQFQGPPPACRLDFALCILELRVPCQTSSTTGAGDLTLASGHAREVLERELKPGSASSRGSRTDVNASEAFFPLEERKGEETEPQPEVKVNHLEDGASAREQREANKMDSVCVCLLNGGMDTEGEIFDDTLVFAL